MKQCSALLNLVIAIVVIVLPGCVERTMKIQTEPAGANVMINDEEVGVSPIKFSFLWYGDYDIIVRKPGFATLKTHYTVKAPWYQLPPFDLVAETMIPWMIRDEHELPVLTLEPAERPTIEKVVERATQMRDEAVYAE